MPNCEFTFGIQACTSFDTNELPAPVREPALLVSVFAPAPPAKASAAIKSTPKSALNSAEVFLLKSVPPLLLLPWVNPRASFSVRVLSGGGGKVVMWLRRGEQLLDKPASELGLLLPVASVPSGVPLKAGSRRLGDRIGDVVLKGVTMIAALGAVVLLGAIVWKVIALAWPAIAKYGL